MSLFDVIKYSATDLESQEELQKLPEDLINLYHTKWLGELVYDRYTDHSLKCLQLANGATYEGKLIHKIFIKTLEEYDT